MSWYFSKNGMQLGPVAEEEFLAKLKSGEVLATDLVWKEGMSDWKPCSQVPELQDIRISPPPESSSSVSSPAPTGLGHIPLQQPVAYPSGHRPHIPSYLWQSIVATALCCMPFGIPAIVYAARVDVLQANGDFVGAESASRSAKTWVIVSAAFWITGMIGYVVLFAFGASSAP